MANYVLDKAYRVSETDGIEAGRVVVRGPESDECALPTKANAGNVLGITTHNQPRQNRYIGVRRMGIATTVAAGAIERGEPVCIADTEGRIAQIAFPRFELGATEEHNALDLEWKDLTSFSLTTNVAVVDAGSAVSFSWSFQNSTLTLTPTNNGADITMTAAELKTALEADATLSRILKVSHQGTSNGSGVVAAEVVTLANVGTWQNPIGIAEQPATQAGDLIDVMLTV
jgi:hypothetical protein